VHPPVLVQHGELVGEVRRAGADEGGHQRALAREAGGREQQRPLPERDHAGVDEDAVGREQRDAPAQLRVEDLDGEVRRHAARDRAAVQQDVVCVVARGGQREVPVLGKPVGGLPAGG
jgi:hypothetical protein